MNDLEKRVIELDNPDGSKTEVVFMDKDVYLKLVTLLRNDIKEGNSTDEFSMIEADAMNPDSQVKVFWKQIEIHPVAGEIVKKSNMKGSNYTAPKKRRKRKK